MDLRRAAWWTPRGSWFEIYGTWETIGAQLLAATFVVGSYVLAQHLKVTRPARRGEQPATRPEAPPERGYALAGSSSAPGWMIPDS